MFSIESTTEDDFTTRRSFSVLHRVTNERFLTGRTFGVLHLTTKKISTWSGSFWRGIYWEDFFKYSSWTNDLTELFCVSVVICVVNLCCSCPVKYLFFFVIFLSLGGRQSSLFLIDHTGRDGREKDKERAAGSTGGGFGGSTVRGCLW